MDEKRFRIEYTPFDTEGFRFHMDMLPVFSKEEIATFCHIPGILQIRNTKNYHICIQVAEFIEDTDIGMALIVFMEQMGYTNHGDVTRNNVMNISEESKKKEMEKRMENDPMFQVLKSALGIDSIGAIHSIEINPKNRDSDFDILNRKLEEAAKNEDYETAAKLRDQIANIKKANHE